MKITSEEFRKQIERWGFWEESPEIIIFSCDKNVTTERDIYGSPVVDYIIEQWRALSSKYGVGEVLVYC